MALLPDSLRLTDSEKKQLEEIRAHARARHEAARLAARRIGRFDFPLFPYECSWAYEEEFRKRNRITRRLSR